MYWKALLISFVMAVVAHLTSGQYLGLGGVVGKLTPRTGSAFPAYAQDPGYAARSGRGVSIGRIRDYGYSAGGSYRPSPYQARSSYGRR